MSNLEPKILHWLYVLPTALVKLFVDDEFIGYHRALIDSGSQPNLIAHNVVKYNLALSKNVYGSVTGIEEIPLRIRKSIIVHVQPWYDSSSSAKIPIEFWLLPKASKWAPTLPERAIKCSEIGDSLSPTLADPVFWKSATVSVLIGIAMWPMLIENLIY